MLALIHRQKPTCSSPEFLSFTDPSDLHDALIITSLESHMRSVTLGCHVAVWRNSNLIHQSCLCPNILYGSIHLNDLFP